MNISIDKALLDILPDFTIYAVAMDVSIENSDRIAPIIKKTEEKIKEDYSLEDVLNIPLIKQARDSYKKLGKDPSRYRLAVESLYRRIVKGNSLYLINNVVDAGNLLSITTKRSIAVLDYDKIAGNILIRIGTDADEYEGIGRGPINIEKIPVYVDDISPFGTPTSDTYRTMVTENTKRILVLIICFSDENGNEDQKEAQSLFETYCYAQNIINIEVRKMVN